jgi:AcrR family transcriptional regulator
MKPDEKTSAARRRRPRRSREEVSQALIDAAAALFAERDSGHVTVRDIAARADVNTTFVARYFGSKHNLMRAAMAQAQQHVVARIEEMADVVEGGPPVFHAVLLERQFVATLARATLDGVFDGVPQGTPALGLLLERFESELQAGGAPGHRDPRVIVACLASAAMGYALFGGYIRHGTGLDDEPEERVEAALVEVLQEVARLALKE